MARPSGRSVLPRGERFLPCRKATAGNSTSRHPGEELVQSPVVFPLHGVARLLHCPWIDKEAVVTANKLVCPHCGHDGTVETSKPPLGSFGFNYLAEGTVCREVRGFDAAGRLLLSGDFRCEGSVGANARIECRSCWRTFAVPEDASPAPSSAETESRAQLEAVIAQIQAAMTAEQIQAIADMQITQETAMTYMEELGITMGGPQQGGNPPQQGTPPAEGTPPAGGPGGGGGPQGGQPPSGGQGRGGGQMSAPPGGGGRAGGMMPSALLDALIELLETRSGNQSTSTTARAMPARFLMGPGGGPGGPPPGGAGGFGGPGDASASAPSEVLAAYTVDGGAETISGRTFIASDTDESAIYVANGGALTLTDATITTTGNTSSSDSSSFYGVNAAVLVASGGAIHLSNSAITTEGEGANGVFATGEGSSVTLSDVTINAVGNGAHAVMATLGGAMTLTHVDMTTAGASSGAIATDRGGGTIIVTGEIGRAHV